MHHSAKVIRLSRMGFGTKVQNISATPWLHALVTSKWGSGQLLEHGLVCFIGCVIINKYKLQIYIARISQMSS